MPYRASSGSEQAIAPEEGIVSDLIKQFADPFAFFRELVQNAIDAESADISIRIIWDDDTVRVSVKDKGTGMSQDIIENKLLVLFRSGKEGMKGKIGKFGIGFVSIFAMNPLEVIIDTTERQSLKRLQATLYIDQSYELFDLGHGSEPGTTVTIVIPAQGKAWFETFVDDALAATKRWCRYAAVPIRFVAFADEDSEPTEDITVNEVLELADCIETMARTKNDGTKIVVGLPRTGALPKIGFYNSGLTLFEGRTTTAHLQHSRLSYKVQSDKLEHTLSRDTVRKDEGFYQVVEELNAVARALGTKIAKKLSQEFDRSLAIRFVAAFGRDRLQLPVAHPSEEQKSISFSHLHNIEIGYTSKLSELSEALSRSLPILNTNIVPLEILGDGVRPYNIDKRWTLVLDVAPKPGEDQLLLRVTQLLGEAHRSPKGVMLGRFIGAETDELFVATKPTQLLFDGNKHVNLPKNAFRMLRRLSVFLNVEHEAVQAARHAHVKGYLELAAQTLSRMILAEIAPVDETRSDVLAESALRRLLGGE